jgi:hypothetical protein
MSLHINKGNNPSRTYNSYNYLCTKHGIPNFVKQHSQALWQGKIGPDSMIVYNLNTTLLSTNKSSKQKADKKTLKLNYTIIKMGLVHIYVENVFFFNSYGTFSKIDHIWSHKTSLNDNKKGNVFLYLIRVSWNKDRNQYEGKKSIENIKTQEYYTVYY